MSKYIIFGCGDVGEKAFRHLTDAGHDVIYFTDNDPKKWNKCLYNVPILPPDALQSLSFDYIAIAVFKAVTIIKQQLLSYGIEETKIKIPIEPRRIFPLTATDGEQPLTSLPREEYISASTLHYKSLKIVIDDLPFLNALEHLKKVLLDNHIPRSKVCVISGAVFQAYGLRRSSRFDDIDIIMTSDLRDIYGQGLVILSELVEMHPSNEYPISDDEIINNPDYHFIFNDLKFVNLNIEKKKQNKK